MENNSNFKLIKQGAEGRIFSGSYLNKQVIVKERFIKKYRHPILDKTLTNERMKAEVRGIKRCKKAGIFTPAIYLVDLKNRLIYFEEILNSVTAKEYINSLSQNLSDENKMQLNELMKSIGEAIGKMHARNIVHGDLTSSNILVKDGKVYIIDFGLSQFKNNVENKAVDLYVLEKALLSTHENSQDMFDKILVSYQQHNPKFKEVVNRFKDVRARGRKRTMVG